MWLRRVGQLPLPTIFTRSFVTSNLRMSPARLDGKVAIVTASTDGIGLAIAKRLARDGAKVLISSRKQKNVDKALEYLKGQEGVPGNSVKGVVCHVADGEQRKKLIDACLGEFGGIDILVSNAATNPVMGATLDCPEDAWDKIFEVNVKAPFLLTKEVKPHLEGRAGASIVYVSSIAGFQPFQILGPYSVSKTALLGLTKVIAQELGPDKIRVNCVAPGVIRTRFSSALTDTSGISDKMLELIPLGRFGESDEIASLVAFLVSDDASFITGETYVAAGGQASRL